MKNAIGVLLGYAVFSIIGVPLAIAGRITGSEMLRGAWSRSAMSFGYAFAGDAPAPMQPALKIGGAAFVQLQKGDDYQPSEACKQALIRDHLVNVYLHHDRIERVLKVPVNPLPWQRAREGTAFSRVVLRPLKADFLRKQGMEFTLDSAIALTRQEIEGGRIDKALAREEAVREERRASSHQLFADPHADEARAPSGAGLVPNEAQAGRVVKSATGEVTFAGKNTVYPKGRNPYDTFSVVIAEDGGQQVTFSGVDLKEKFESGAFSLGQRIELLQRRVEFESELGGTTRTQTKNVYDVKVVA